MGFESSLVATYLDFVQSDVIAPESLYAIASDGSWMHVWISCVNSGIHFMLILQWSSLAMRLEVSYASSYFQHFHYFFQTSYSSDWHDCFFVDSLVNVHVLAQPIPANWRQ